MSGGIFVEGKDGKLIELREAPYDSEGILQELIAKHPNLLAGEQIDSGEPRRWMLVSREVGIPDEDEGGDRWSLDHFLLDQDAIPTIVEVKRSSDTRIRREVVGQVLDYAAHAVQFLSIDSIRAALAKSCQDAGEEPDERVRVLIGSSGSVQDFWKQVELNLRARRVRLLFVADVIPPELRQVVEFLNAEMKTAEVLAIEIRQFAGGGMKTFVPRVLGGVAEASTKGSGRGQGRQWDRASLLAAIGSRAGRDAERAAKSILDWWAGLGYEGVFSDSQTGSFLPFVTTGSTQHWPFKIGGDGDMRVNFHYLRRKPPFAEPEKRRAVLRKLSEASGVNFPDSLIDGMPKLAVGELLAKDRLKLVLGVLETIARDIQSANS